MKQPIRENVTENEASKTVASITNLRSLVREGRFDADLESLADSIAPSLDGVLDFHPLTYFKGVAVCNEVYDYYAKFGKARAVIERIGVGTVAELGSLRIKPETELDRTLAKQKIIVALEYAKTAFYRQHLYIQASEIADECYRVLNLLIREDDPALVTSTKVHLFRGQVFRQLSEYGKSWDAYVKAIESLVAHLEKSDRYGSELRAAGNSGQMQVQFARFEAEKAAINRSMALCFAPRGLGWLAYVRGQLEQAKPFVLAASIWLHSTGDWVAKGYTRMLHGMILRATAGYDTARLRQAISVLRESYSVFERHAPYRARAAYELALCHTYLDEAETAEKYIGAVLDIVTAEPTRDVRWECKALVVKSRIKRKAFDYAWSKRLAEEALQKAVDSNQILCEIDSLIARAESLIELKQYKDAERDIKAAQSRAQNNIQTLAACDLHLCRIYLKQGKLARAEDRFRSWTQVSPRIENGIVHSMAATIQKELDTRSQDFIIEWGSNELKYDVQMKRLRQFLLRRARSQYQSSDRVAASLGISRQTLHNWESE